MDSLTKQLHEADLIKISVAFGGKLILMASLSLAVQRGFYNVLTDCRSRDEDGVAR